MDLASHPEFMAGNVDTDFIPRHYQELFPKKTVSDQSICEAAMAVVLQEQLQRTNGSQFLNDNGARSIAKSS